MRARRRLSSVEREHAGSRHGRRPGEAPAGSALDEGGAELLEIEGVALGAGDDLPEFVPRERAALRQGCQQRSGGVVRQRHEPDLVRSVNVVREGTDAHPPALGRGVHHGGRDHEHRGEIDELEQLLCQIAGRRICEVEILYGDHDRPLSSEAHQPLLVGAANLGGEGVGLQQAEALVALRVEPHRQEAREVGKDLGRLGNAQQPQLCPQLRPDRELGLSLLDPDPAAEHLDERAVQELGSVREASSVEPGGSPVCDRSQLGEEAGLADATVSEHEENLAAARDQLVDDTPEPLNLGVPPDERCLDVVGVLGLDPDELPGLHGLHSALDGHLSERLEDEPVDQDLGRGLPDRDGAGGGHPLEARRDVVRVTERHGLRIRCSYQADRGGPGVDSYAGVEVGDAPGRRDLVRVLSELSENAKRRTGRPLGVVLVRGRNPEECCDAVAHVRAHRPAELLHGVRHAADTLADQHLHLVWWQTLAETGRPNDVGEERRHRTEFVALERRRMLGRTLDHGPLANLGRGRCRRRRALGEQGGGAEDRVLLAGPDLDLERCRPHVDDVAAHELLRTYDALAVHPGPVHRSEVLDLEASGTGSHDRMTSRDQRIVDREIGVDAPNEQLRADNDPAPREWAVLQEQRRH